VRSLAFDADGKHLLVGGGGDGRGAAVLWEVGAGGRLGRGRVVQAGRETVWQVAFSPDGRAVALASGDGAVDLRRWDGEKASQRSGVLLQHQRRVTALAFSPDSRLLLTGGVDRTARVWDAETGQAVGQPLRHPGAVWAAAFLDEHTALTGCRDGAVRCWDVRAALPVGPPLRHGGVVWAVACRPRDRVVATGSEDNTARVWQLPAPAEGGVDQLTCWVQVMTALELDDRGVDQQLDVPTWDERRKRLHELGGPPAP
jgi:hypothetical protein